MYLSFFQRTSVTFATESSECLLLKSLLRRFKLTYCPAMAQTLEAEDSYPIYFEPSSRAVIKHASPVEQGPTTSNHEFLTFRTDTPWKIFPTRESIEQPKKRVAPSPPHLASTADRPTRPSQPPQHDHHTQSSASSRPRAVIYLRSLARIQSQHIQAPAGARAAAPVIAPARRC